VPAKRYVLVIEAIREQLSRIRVGDPRNTEIQMGPVVGRTQQRSVLEGIARLAAEGSLAFGANLHFQPLGVRDPEVAAFVEPTLLTHARPLDARAIHEVEVFGPVATVMPYRDLSEALRIARLGRGSLVASVFTGDPAVAITAALELGSTHGRVHVVSAEVARSQSGHGNVMPMSLHGGPGRAGGGQELGGLRALRFYHQFIAVQGPSRWLGALSKQAAELRS
jgi:3,4-dehydroadipyl-CoA semialdehyde dehydrogenase